MRKTKHDSSASLWQVAGTGSGSSWCLQRDRDAAPASAPVGQGVGSRSADVQSCTRLMMLAPVYFLCETGVVQILAQQSLLTLLHSCRGSPQPSVFPPE